MHYFLRGLEHYFYGGLASTSISTAIKTYCIVTGKMCNFCFKSNHFGKYVKNTSTYLYHSRRIQSHYTEESVWVCDCAWYYDIVYLSTIILSFVFCIIVMLYRAVIARAEPQWICGAEKREERKKRIQNGATNTIFQFRSYRTDRVDRRRRTSGAGRVTHDAPSSPESSLQQWQYHIINTRLRIYSIAAVVGHCSRLLTPVCSLKKKFIKKRQQQ